MYRYYLIPTAEDAPADDMEIDEPIGWDKFETVLKRSARHGIVSEFSEVQLRFECGTGGYGFLLAEYERHGSDGSMRFQQTYTCNGVTETIYEANINFNSLLHVPGEYIEVSLENVGFGNLLLTRDKSKVNMAAETDLDGNAITTPETQPITLHSRAIVKQFRGEERDPNDPNNYPGPATFDAETMGQLFVHKGWQGLILNEIEDQFTYSTNFQLSNPVTFDEYLFVVKEAGVYTFDIDISFIVGVTETVNGLKGFEFRWILRINGTEHALSNAIKLSNDYSEDDYISPLTRSVIQHTETLKVGDKVYFFGFMNKPLNGGAPQKIVTHEIATDVSTNHLYISALTTTPATSAPVWKVADILNQQITSVTGFPDRLRSEYFTNGCGKDYVLTNGFKIRQFPDEPLTISRAESWEGLNPILALGEGLGYDGNDEVVIMEPVEHFYQDSEIIRFEEVADYAEEVAGEYIYNTAEFGYEKSNTDEFNALDEFNSRREYQTPIRTSENKLTALSKFVASMYAIETQRRKPYVEGRKVSSTFDKDTFIIAASRNAYPVEFVGGTANQFSVSGLLVKTAAQLDVMNGPNTGIYTVTAQSYSANTDRTTLTVTPPFPDTASIPGTYAFLVNLEPERDEIFSTVENLIAPETMYNGRISPLRNALRWASVLNSGLWFKKPYDNVLRFTAGEGNSEFQHQLTLAASCPEGDPDRELLTENDSLQLARLNRFRKIWKPEYITFKAPVTSELKEQIRQALIPQISATEKLGYITVWDGNAYQQGYLLEMRYKPANQTGELSSFKLIKKATNSLAPAPVGGMQEFSSEFSTEFN